MALNNTVFIIILNSFYQVNKLGYLSFGNLNIILTTVFNLIDWL